MSQTIVILRLIYIQSGKYMEYR